jgi:hypothetical protein
MPLVSWRVVSVALAVLAAHAALTALTGVWVGPAFVLVLSSGLAVGLWATVKVGRRGPLPARVRAALLAVWLVPLALAWVLAVYGVLFRSLPSDVPDGAPDPWLSGRTGV